ncbi:MAG: F-box domain protein [Barrevirus sp.]|uniref:F-box domain protein n=1 Tax=Barrevirus sp. TaxID=2487763 RepID=A0A3G4ZPK1_9VIRU|nr:MAG: F-box domain protein [Barrevirus sp.]
MDTLLPEILSLIFEFLNTKQLIWAKRTCKKWRKVYQDNLWRYTIDLESWGYQILGKHLKEFRNVKTIKLKKCIRLTGPCLKYLDKATNVDLSHCKIKSTDLQYLTSVKTLNLRECVNLTDDALEYVSNVETIDIYGCYNLTSNGFNHIKNAKNIIICACYGVIQNLISNNFNNLTIYNCINYKYDSLLLLKEKYPNISILKIEV